MVVKYMPSRQSGREEWRDAALCLEFYSEIFHPGKGGSTKDAKWVCSRCDVRTQCLQEALNTEQVRGERVTGIWGGTTERERKHILRKQAAA